jgi:two-component system, cell cycle sensor histidine kinase and response regulator CckA
MRNQSMMIRRSLVRNAAFVGAAYVAVGVLWITATDRIVNAFTVDPATRETLQLVKGNLWILITAAIIFALVRAYRRASDVVESSAVREAQRYKAQFEYAPLPGYVFRYGGNDFVLVDFNDSARKASPALDTKRNLPPAAFFDDSGAVRDLMLRSIETRQIMQHDFEWGSEGVRTNVRMSFAPIPPDLVLIYIEDVTDLIAAKAAVEESEKRYRQIYDYSPDVIFHLGRDSRIRSLNGAFEHATGFRASDWIGRSVFDLFDQDSLEKVREVFDTKIETNSSEVHEYPFITASGERRTFGVKTAVIRDERGEFVALTGFARDLTAERRALQNLRDAEARFRTFMDMSPAVAWIKDDQLRYVYVSGPWVTAMGLTAEQIEGKTDEEIFPRDLAREYMTNDRKVLATGQPLEIIERGPANVTSPGGSRPFAVILVLKFPLVMSGRTYVGGIAVDVTDFELAKGEAEAQRNFLGAVIDTMSEAIVACDETGTIKLLNRSMINVNGDLRGFDLDDKDWSALGWLYDSSGSRKLEREEIPLYRALQGEYFRNNEVVFKDEGGGRSFLVSGQPVLGPGGKKSGAVVVARDVSEERSMRATIEQNARLSSLGRLAASIAHEFNNVLMGIQPFAEIISRGANGDPRLSSASAAIRESVRRGKAITADVLRFARPAELTLEPLDLQSWYASLDIQLRDLLPPQVELVIDVPGESIVAAVDRSQLEQVVTNLVLNAKDAMPYGGAVRVSAAPNAVKLIQKGLVDDTRGRDAVLSVADSGAGIPPEVLPHIFEPLFTTKRSGGTGLGLAISHSIIARHGGQIVVETSSESGTIFHVLLPRSDAALSQSPAEPEPSPRTSRKILIVEDDVNVAAGLFAVLTLQHDVTLVENGTDALSSLEGYVPDVVVLDVRLPDMDGTEVFRRMRRKQPDLPVIFSTGHADERQIGDVLLQPNVRYLLKPYESETLLRLVDELAEKR